MINGFEKAIGYLAGLTLAAFTIIILIEVVFRYWLHIPLSWPNELSILLFQWMVFFGAPVGLRRGIHFTVDVVVVLLPTSVQRVLSKFVVLIALAVGIALTVLSYRMAISTWNTTYTSLPIPVAVSFIGAMLSGGLIVLFCFPLLWQDSRAAATNP
jgi:TRAP-type C4-dicarboxylate transport system permease small subunit